MQVNSSLIWENDQLAQSSSFHAFWPCTNGPLFCCHRKFQSKPHYYPLAIPPHACSRPRPRLWERLLQRIIQDFIWLNLELCTSKFLFSWNVKSISWRTMRFTTSLYKKARNRGKPDTNFGLSILRSAASKRLGIRDSKRAGKASAHSRWLISDMEVKADKTENGLYRGGEGQLLPFLRGRKEMETTTYPRFNQLMAKIGCSTPKKCLFSLLFSPCGTRQAWEKSHVKGEI